MVRDLYARQPLSLAAEFFTVLGQLVAQSRFLPHALSFSDATIGNFFCLPDETVAIDWSGLGTEPLGADGGCLVGSALTWGRRFADVAASERELFESYAEVLERGEGLSTRVLWVLAENGGIYLVLGDPGRDVQRLDAAGAVYGLSAAQRLVAGYIVEGMSLPETARTMGVRPATVRTHLERMFVKTGVHNQTALVRVLLSAAAPL